MSASGWSPKSKAMLHAACHQAACSRAFACCSGVPSRKRTLRLVPFIHALPMGEIARSAPSGPRTRR